MYSTKVEKVASQRNVSSTETNIGCCGAGPKINKKTLNFEDLIQGDKLHAAGKHFRAFS